MNAPGKTKFSKADLLFQKAFMAHRAGRLEEAEVSYRKVLRKAPSNFEALYLLGTVCSQQRKLEEAIGFLKQALDIDPRHAETLNNLGLTLVGTGFPDKAEPYYRRALACRADYPDAHSNLAHALQLMGRLDEAETHVRQALQLAPDMANAHYILGLIMLDRDRFEEAARCFNKGLQLKPDLSAAYNDLGGVYMVWGKLDQAMSCFSRAIELNPLAFNSHNNLGMIFEELGRFDEALAEFEKAVELQPDDTAAQWNMAYLFLRRGMLERGWEAHELRLKIGLAQDRFPYRQWDGSSLEGKSVLLFAEQGLGDEIFYGSCIPDVVARAKHVVIECDKRLAPLYARSFPGATIQGSDRMDINWIFGMPKFDWQSPVGSLPRFLRPTIESFPDKPAYLVADPVRVEYWRSRLAMLGSGLKVGICWRSGMTKAERHKHYSQLSQWKGIFSLPGIHFVKLQYDECEAELREAEELFDVSIERFPELDMKNQLDDTSALISALDVVITAGTAVAEMAGALGVETYRLDVYGKPMDALGTGGSPWHPKTRLFGQQSIGDWEIPLALAGEALKEKASGHLLEVEYVPLARGYEIAVPGSPDDLETYVLKEQQGWWDAEYSFVLGMLPPDANAADVGAGSGAYAIPLAASAVQGRVWATVDKAAHAELLMKSRARNQLEKRLNLFMLDAESAFSDEAGRRGMENIFLCRLSASYCTFAFLEGAAGFFASQSPLVMFAAVLDEAKGFDPAQWFASRGYGIYRFVPGLGALVPVGLRSELDAFGINLFACKSDRAQILEQAGLLVVQGGTPVPAVLPNSSYWQDYLRDFPYAAELVDGWDRLQQDRAKDWQVYWMSLDLYAMSQSMQRPLSERYACLQAAAGAMNVLIREQPNLPRVLSFCRMLSDLGQRAVAVDLLNQLCMLLNSGATRVLNEPCLALDAAHAAMRPEGRVGDWIVAQVLEQREKLRAFSSFFTGQESLAALEEVRRTGFCTEETVRRIELIKARFPGA